MAVQLLDILAHGVRDASDNVVQSGKVTSYEPGTTTLKTLFEEFELLTPLPNPATLDAVGRLIAYSSDRVKLVIEKSDGTSVRTIDDVGISDADISSAATGAVSIVRTPLTWTVYGTPSAAVSAGAIPFPRLVHTYRHTFDLTVTDAFIFIPTDGTSGSVTYDILLKRGAGAFTSIFSTKPSITAGVGDNAKSINQVLQTVDIKEGDIFNIELTAYQVDCEESTLYLRFTQP